MGDQYYIDEYDEELDMDELADYMSPDEGDGDLAGFERPEMKVDFSTAVVISNLPQVHSLSITNDDCIYNSARFPSLDLRITDIQGHAALKVNIWLFFARSNVRAVYFELVSPSRARI